MDLNMPVLGGVEATERIRAAGSDTAVLVLTTFDDDESILAALRPGASGYLTKDAGRATILNAVRTVAQGQTVLARPRSSAACWPWPPARPGVHRTISASPHGNARSST